MPPREYDRTWTANAPGPARRNIGYDEGMSRFFVQLEYHHDGEWREVVRFDHDASGEVGHDVTEEGIHMDIYRDGEKVDSPEVFPPMPAIDAFTHAENHIASHAEQYIERFEQWHGIVR